MNHDLERRQSAFILFYLNVRFIVLYCQNTKKNSSLQLTVIDVKFYSQGLFSVQCNQIQFIR